MRLIADLHIHSKYSRAVSKDMIPAVIAEFALKKGVGLVGTGDFTHPEWVRILESELEETPNGFAVLKGTTAPLFTYTVEISCIYSKGGATRRIHQVVVAPTLEVVKRINTALAQIGNLKADGRPILGCDAKEIVRIATEASPEAFVIPAHAWTPWFSLFGSQSGFDSLKDCYEEQTERISAIETGLSSDPPMNWRLSQLDTVQIVSFSDAHSARKMGREATVFELAKPTYANLLAALRKPTADNRVAETIEFFPEEGKYHWDGHRSCGVRWSPSETAKHKALCPKCGKRVTVGVMHRVDKLADRPAGYAPGDRPGFRSLIPLDEIIADALGVKGATKKVLEQYDAIVKGVGSEFTALLDAAPEQLKAVTLPRIAEGILRVREGKVDIRPGYDGVFGTIRVFKGGEKGTPSGQKTLF
ncbi:MAG: DNA helicase UvrD [Candidatus Kerfeldbacteria bacterium]|nr:DNA helicase UvrD [Candidatus Kerfeldbacteria bacterium]